MDNTKPTFVLDFFEGPLDLLLHLIAKNKVDIYDIPIGSITKQYLAYLQEAKQFDMEIGSEFLVMASELLYIKSKMLLPKEKTPETEDPRSELVAKLLDYQAYKRLAAFLAQQEEESTGVYYRPREQFDFTPLDFKSQWFRLADLTNAFLAMMQRRDEPAVERARETLSTKIVKKVIYPVADKVIEVKQKLAGGDRLTFSDFFEHAKEKSECISVFLAILELVKNQKVKLRYSYAENEFILEDGEPLGQADEDH